MKKVFFLGSKNIGFECLKHIYDNQNNLGFKLIGVLTNPRGKKIIEYCREKSIMAVKNPDEFLDTGSCDIAISVQYDKILKKSHISRAKEIFVNLHMAPLPEYRGCNQFSFAIIDSAKEFGTTIHQLEEGIDSGAIIFEDRFPISKNCWVNELYELTSQKSIELFKKSLPLIVSGNFEPKPQKSFLHKRKTSLHFRKEIEELKQIDLSWPRKKIERHIRATDMPDFDPPYTFINNQKVHFRRGSFKE